MRSTPRTVPLATGLALAVMLGACGGSSGPTTTTPPTPPPPPPVRTVILSGSGSLPASTLDAEHFTTSTTGTLDITVDWTFTASPIGVYVVRGACTLDQFNARTCNFLTRSETTQKPRKITMPSFAAGSYDLLIGNFADVDESISFEIALTTGGGASAASTGASGAGRDPRIAGALKAAASH